MCGIYGIVNNNSLSIDKEAVKNSAMLMKHRITPAYVLDNPLKFGFTTPLSKNFQDINSEANKILLSDKCINRNIFNYHELKELILEHTENKSDHSSFLFRLLSVELWFRTFIDK